MAQLKMMTKPSSSFEMNERNLRILQSEGDVLIMLYIGLSILYIGQSNTLYGLIRLYNLSVMGNNPTKSQQLQSMFPEFKVMAELTCQPSNLYQLIFVSKNKEIFVIKESAKQAQQISHPNTTTLLQSREIDGSYLSLYEWYPQSVQNFLQANPNHLDQGFAIFLLSTCLNVYGSFWRNNDGAFVDIRSENIKISRKNSGLSVKVLPPGITRKEQQHQYQNTVRDLGFIVKKIVQPKLHMMRPEISSIIERMISCRVVNTEIWKSFQNQVAGLGEHMRRSEVSPNKNLNRTSPVPLQYSSVRPASPVPERRISYQTNQAHQYRPNLSPHQYSSQRPVSPVQVKPVSPVQIRQVQPVYSHQINLHQRPSSVTLHQHPGSFVRENRQQSENLEVYQTQILEMKKPKPYFSRINDKSPGRQEQRVEQREQRVEQRVERDGSPRKLVQVGVNHQQRQLKNASPARRTKVNGKLQQFAFFRPSLCEGPELKPKSGVPSPYYTPKTKPDKHTATTDLDEKPQHKREVKANHKAESSFITKHLITQQPPKQLESPRDQRSSSFGFSVSEESESSTLYDGTYDGEYHPLHPNIRHGIGKLVLPSGGSYQGNFSWNKMDGWGKLFYPSGRLAYQGYWKHGKFDGYGKLFNENPQHIDLFDYSDFNLTQNENSDGYWKVYEGSMRGDAKQGHGIWIFENGQKYQGEFHDDEVHGDGIFHGKKETIEGHWEHNKLVYIRRQE